MLAFALLPATSSHYLVKFNRRGCWHTKGSEKPRSTLCALNFKPNAQPHAKINGSSNSIGLTTFLDATRAECESHMNDNQFGLGRMIVLDGLVFRQNFTIRSYEIGADRLASIETILNKIQETSLNLFKTAGLNRDSFGTTWEMNKRNLIWVLAKLQVQVDRYPTWGDIIQVDTGMSRYGKNGMRINWLIRDFKTKEILARASSAYMMIDKLTRKLSRMPEKVQEELEPYFLNSGPYLEESMKLPKLDSSTADYMVSGLTPRWSDLDLNQHVNNVKYTNWILMSVPYWIFETHGLSAITIEYRKECGLDNNVLRSQTKMISEEGANKFHQVLDFQHLLELEKGPEIVRARTEWRPKRSNNKGFLEDLSAR